jgi:lysylphosphatidylglycerol synthetase-like protein (DUF2156 family)
VSGKPTVVQMTELKHPNGQSPAVSSLHAGKTMAAIVPVVAAFDFRRLTMTMATIGIVAKVMLFIVVFTTPGETLVSDLLILASVVFGLLTVMLAFVGLVYSRGKWMFLLAPTLGLLCRLPLSSATRLDARQVTFQ